ncbi:nucleoside-diphosphate-sugar epimerase [Microbacterium resistens]|uniref:Nucleoside-diphosphate-sugar epimerase n=1 Tax=Microbacterium resistens TaxID=156977 RepID=A0ABU1SAG5_9MICO|nr:NAD-dependent epimerase/dehydratase family protein [Microbacterium resistens]MDR6866584.1 nucleoside-diphosphate-sugar epimerase [Microbacterium resistens]
MTGASGFVGGAVADALAADGHDVVGFGRRANGWSHPGGEYRVWDLPSAEAPADAGTFHAVVHCAGLADDHVPVQESMRVNVGGTVAVAEAFAHARLVHVSSSSVYDMRHPSVRAHEDRGPARRHLNGYSLSKALAEEALRGRDAVILRPHAVYGPGDATLLPRLEAAVRRGRLVLPRGGRVLHSLTGIGNLVDAVRLGLDGVPGTYNVTDASPVLLREFIAEALRLRGRDVRVTGVPFPVAYAAGAAADAAHRVIGVDPMLSRYRVAQLGRERTYDLGNAQRGLGYRPADASLEGAEGW